MGFGCFGLGAKGLKIRVGGIAVSRLLCLDPCEGSLGLKVSGLGF